MSTDSKLSQQLQDLQLIRDTLYLEEKLGAEDEARCLAVLDKIITETLEAKNTQMGVVNMALEVLDEQGYKVVSMATKAEAGYIRPFLDISTMHLTEEDAGILGLVASGSSPLSLMADHHGGDDDFGFWLYAEHEDTGSFKNAPKSIQAVMRFARSLGCDWICLDRDATVTSELPVYDW